MVSLGKCERCGGSLIADDEELKCLACGRSSGSRAMRADEAKAEVEADAVVAWNEFVAGRRKNRKGSTGISGFESEAEYNHLYYEAHKEQLAEYKRVYHEAHGEQNLARMLRWNRSHRAHLIAYRRRWRAGLKLESA